jgi:hypothetical protein
MQFFRQIIRGFMAGIGLNGFYLNKQKYEY